ncbi:hypothetical protein HYU14_03695 [Candidatus Woesearchaeota archaeon]|nr:hypothetical protein [Candidatus Woesearchaeota archaeon]
MSGGHGGIYSSWVESGFVIALIAGFLFSLSAGSTFITYALVVIVGMMFGKVIYNRRHNLLFPYYALIVGFLVGYLLGLLYGSWIIAALLFFISAYGSYKAHEKGIFKGGFGKEK